VHSKLIWEPGRTHTEAPGLVRGSTPDQAVILPSDDYWFAAQLGIIPLLDGNVKGVQVDVDDFLHHLLAFYATSGPCETQ
jgi:hypothetical protein